MDTQEIPSDISEDGPLSPFLSHNNKNRRHGEDFPGHHLQSQGSPSDKFEAPLAQGEN